MRVVCNLPGSHRAKGYTETDDEQYCWVYDGESEEVSFYRDPPDKVVWKTERFVSENAPFTEVVSNV